MTATTGGSLSVVPGDLFGITQWREAQSSMRQKDGEKEISVVLPFLFLLPGPCDLPKTEQLAV